MPQNITFRTQLLGGVSEFCHNSGLSLVNNPIILVELIVLLARYQEEGIRLCPNVYLTNDIDLLITMLPEGEKIKLGNSTTDVAGIKTTLKKCAPLANDGWLIYIHDKSTSIEYGVFRGNSNPISVKVDDVVMENGSDSIVIKAYQIADDCVEIKTNNGLQHYVFLNHRKEEDPPPLQYLDNLILSITEGVLDSEKESLHSFLSKLLFEALRKSHGCIIAVTNMNRAPVILSNDGVILDKKIDFNDLIIKLKKNEIDSSFLVSKGALLVGMFNSDGIILFDNKGCLLGYNCFIKVSQKQSVIGGARKRAFATLTEKVGHGLSAVFMQSQDGWTDFKGNEYE